MLTTKAAEAGGLLLQKRLKAKNLKQLRKVPAMDIVKNTDFESFWPNVDGYSITDDQYKLYEKGNYNDVNVIIGTNSDEGSMFSRPVSVSDYEKRIHEIYGSWADQVLSLYPAKTEEETYFAHSDIFPPASFT